jgi:excisionase family DNA binding protein
MLLPETRRALENELPPILIVSDICSLLRISPDTVYREIEDKILPAWKVEGEWNVTRADFLEYLERISTL